MEVIWPWTPLSSVTSCLKNGTNLSSTMFTAPFVEGICWEVGTSFETLSAVLDLPLMKLECQTRG